MAGLSSRLPCQDSPRKHDATIGRRRPTLWLLRWRPPSLTSEAAESRAGGPWRGMLCSRPGDDELRPPDRPAGFRGASGRNPTGRLAGGPRPGPAPRRWRQRAAGGGRQLDARKPNCAGEVMDAAAYRARGGDRRTVFCTVQCSAPPQRGTVAERNVAPRATVAALGPAALPPPRTPHRSSPCRALGPSPNRPRIARAPDRPRDTTTLLPVSRSNVALGCTVP